MRNLYILFFLLFFYGVNAQKFEGTAVENAVILQQAESKETNETPAVTARPALQALSGVPTGSSQEVGITDGQLSVALSGAATYNIALKLPPGINKVVPEIGLAYNSQGGNGIAGYGWEISGISSITRIPSTRFHDNSIDEVDFDSFDRFALDGQRLILKSGTYVGIAEYQTENFSNVKINSYGTSPYGSNYGPAYFIVLYPDGTKAYYGNSVDSQGREIWSITSWENAQGVRIDYTYVEDNPNNAIRISKITYGTNSASSYINEIQFTYQLRQRIEQKYIAGQNFAENAVLSQIHVLANGAGYRNYVLDYENNILVYDRLTKITEKSGDNSKSYNPTVFTYDTTANSISYSPVTTTITELSNIASNNARTVSGDYDGDGKMDFIVYATSGALNKLKYWVYTDIFSAFPTVTVDNSTGAFEEIFPVKNLLGDSSSGFKLTPAEGWAIVKPEASQLRIRICSGISAVNPISLQYEKIISNTSIGGNVPRYYYTGDFNGDGLSDIVSVIKSTGQVHFINLDKRIATLFSNAAGTMNETIATADKVMVADFNGDGKTDLFHFKNNTLKVYTINENTSLLSLLYTVTDTAITTTLPILMGDYNGDGKMDFIVPKGNTFNEYRKFTSTGIGVVKTIENYLGITYTTGDATNSYQYIPTDYNNDGKTDLLLFKASGAVGGAGSTAVTCYINTNGVFTSSYSATVSSGTQSGLDAYTMPIFLDPDKSNSGLEIASLRNNKINYFQSAKDFSKERLLQSITTGDGVTESINYSSLSDCTTPGCVSAYQDDAYQQNFPNFDVVEKGNFYVVSQLEKQSANTYQQQVYRYLGAVINYEGMGFLGFKGVLKTNWFENNAEVMSNVVFNDISKRGAIIENDIVQGWGGLYIGFSPTVFVQKSLFGYETELLANKVYKIKNTTVSTFNGLEGTSTTTTNTYDAYYNITNAAFAKKLGTVTEQTGFNTYEYYNNPVATDYYIGLLKKSTTSLTHNSNTVTSEEDYVYNTSKLVSQKQKKGHLTNFITEDNLYDVFGNLTKKTVSSPGFIQRVTSYTYDPSGRFMTSKAAIDGLITTFSNNLNSGNLESQTTPYGLVTTYTYDVWNKMTRETDYLGKNKNTDYTKVGSMNEITVTGDDGSVKYAKFDDLGREIIKGVKNIDDTWSYIKTDYDKYDRKISVSEPYASSPTQFSTTVYDNNGRIQQTVTAAGKTTNITYSGVSTTANDGVSSSTTVKNSLGYIVSKSDNGGVINYQYYADGNMKQSDYEGNVIAIEQDGWGRKIKLTDSSAGVYEYEYNIFGDVTKEINPKGTTTYTLNGTGKMIMKIIEGENTNTQINYTYDSTTKLLIQSNFIDGQPGFIDYGYQYDAYKRLTYTYEWGDYIYERTTTYDDFGRPLKEYYKGGFPFSSTVSSEKWVRNTYKNGYKWQIFDDATNQLLWENTAVNSRQQLTSGKFGNGIVVTNTYDQYGFPSQIKHVTAASVNVMTLTTAFDAQRGNLTSRSNNMFNWNESFQYDNLDRLTTYTNARGEQEQQTYDNKGRITENTLGTYNYSQAKPYQQSTLQISSAGMTYYNNRWGIFNRGMENKQGWTISNPSATIYDTSKAKTGLYSLKMSYAGSQTVDAAGWVAIDNAVATQYTISGWVYTESSAVRLYFLTQTDAQAASSTFSALPINETVTGGWQYMQLTVSIDPTVKRLGARLFKAAAGNVWFDDIRIAKTSDAATFERKLNVTYNVFKSPVNIEETGVDKISFRYNILNGRSAMYYGSTDSDQMVRPMRKNYSADGTMEITYNVVTNKTEFVTFIGGDAYNAPVVFKKKDGVSEFLYLHRDYQGSIVAITNQAGTRVERRLFDAWGNIIKVLDASGIATSGLMVLDRGYTGHEHLQSVALINMNGRLYDPMLHRFLQPDNFVQDSENTQNFNRYGYVYNNPLKYTDPTGEFFLGTIFTAVFSAIGNFIQHGVNFDDYNWSRLQNAWKIDIGLFRLDSNKTFFGQVLQLVSRFTWESPQVTMGYVFSQAKNLAGDVQEVKYFGGATFIIHENSSKRNGMTLGNYANINIHGKLDVDHEGGWMNSEDGLFWHEFGHTFQSIRLGLLYLPIVALPSAISAAKDNKNDTDNHKERWYEKQANRWARRYADKYGYQFDQDPDKYHY